MRKTLHRLRKFAVKACTNGSGLYERSDITSDHSWTTYLPLLQWVPGEHNNFGDIPMPRGVKKSAAGQPTKAELIRKTAKTMGKTVLPRDIIPRLKAQGQLVSSARF